MPYCPFAIIQPGPRWKQGYGRYPSPQPKLGIVKHSMVGLYIGAKARLDGPDRASWHFAVLKNGEIIQHYDSAFVAWHCGVLGSPTVPGNVSLVGVEHEGGPIGDVAEPLTEAQFQASLKLDKWLWQAHGFGPPALYHTYWEHRWLDATACPSGRIPWTRFIPHMMLWLEEVADEMKIPLIQVEGDPGVYKLLPDGSVQVIHTPGELLALRAVGAVTDIQKVSADVLHALPRSPS